MNEPTAAAYPLPPGGSSEGVHGTLGPAEQRTVRRCLWALALLGSGSLVGVALSLYLVNHLPLLLVALSPLGRHLILVAPVVHPAAFVVVVVTRRLVFYLASFFLGRALGPLGIPWIEARAARFAGFVRWLERLFARAPHLVVFGMVGPGVSALAGISRMPVPTFAGLAIANLTLRALLILGVASWIRAYLDMVRGWIDEWWIPGTVLMVALVAVYRWRRRAPTRVMED